MIPKDVLLKIVKDHPAYLQLQPDQQTKILAILEEELVSEPFVMEKIAFIIQDRINKEVFPKKELKIDK